MKWKTIAPVTTNRTAAVTNERGEEGWRRVRWTRENNPELYGPVFRSHPDDLHPGETNEIIDINPE